MENPYTKNLLLVDDHERYLNAFAEDLKACEGNFCILTAGNGKEALNVLESARVDLIVTDLKMPVMDGFEFIPRVKEKYPHMPIIVMSSFLFPEIEKRLCALGVYHCFEKSNSMALKDEILRKFEEAK